MQISQSAFPTSKKSISTVAVLRKISLRINAFFAIICRSIAFFAFQRVTKLTYSIIIEKSIIARAKRRVIILIGSLTLLAIGFACSTCQSVGCTFFTVSRLQKLTIFTLQTGLVTRAGWTFWLPIRTGLALCSSQQVPIRTWSARS